MSSKESKIVQFPGNGKGEQPDGERGRIIVNGEARRVYTWVSKTDIRDALYFALYTVWFIVLFRWLLLTV